jgi:hypothetical protein
MAGIKALQKVQLGRETTAGTAVAASTRWRGQGALEDQRETVFAEEDVGLLIGTDRTYVPRLGGAISMTGDASFEQLPHIFEAGIATATPAADGAGSGYVYTYPIPTTQGGTIKSYTIEGGDNEGAEEMEFCFVDNFTISGAAGEAFQVSAEWMGRQVTPTTFTAAATASIPTVEEMLVSKTKLYIDAATGTAGTTQVSNTLLNVNLSVDTGQQPVYTADGELYFSFVKQVAPEIVLTLTYEHNSSAVAEKVAYRAETARQIRLLCEGSDLTTAGDYSAKTMIIDLVGKYESFGSLEDADGNDTVSCTFRGRYNSDADTAGQFIIVNELSAIP